MIRVEPIFWPEQILHNRTIQGCQGEVTYRYIQKNGKMYAE